MKRKRYTHERIISILKEHEAGQPVGELARRSGVVENTICRCKSKYRRHGGFRRQSTA